MTSQSEHVIVSINAARFWSLFNLLLRPPDQSTIKRAKSVFVHLFSIVFFISIVQLSIYLFFHITANS